MSAELLKLAEELRNSGYSKGAEIIAGLTESLSRTQLIPSSLEGSSSGKGESKPCGEIVLKRPKDKVKGNRNDEGLATALEGSRIGAFVSPELLSQKYVDPTLGGRLKSNIKVALRHLAEYQKESVYNLCLPTRIVGGLTRRVVGCNTIGQLRELVKSGRVISLRDIAVQSYERITDSLKEFDELRSREQN